MPELDDNELLAEFARNESEPAFAALVARYVNLVYSAALRFAGNPHHAEEITQAVFIILARKAESLGPDILLSGWLYQTTRLTAANFVKGEIRRQRREQEVFMQSTLNEPDPAAWEQIAPLLEEAMGCLGETDRNAVVLRFFENKTALEVGVALKMKEETAQKRVNRAVEKLRKFFTQRGVTFSALAIAGSVSANSVQAAPVALAKTITAVAVAKGAAAGGSTLTLVKGALKLMAWMKIKTAVVVGVGVLLAAGTTTVIMKDVQDYRTDLWEVPSFDSTNNIIDEIPCSLLRKTPPQVRIVTSKYDHLVGGLTDGGACKFINGEWITTTNISKSIGVGYTLDRIVKTAYDSPDLRTVFAAEMPKGRYSYIANLPHDSMKVLQKEIKKQFGLVGTRRMVETNVLLLRLVNPGLEAFKPANSVRLKKRTNLDAVGLTMEDSDSESTRKEYIETRYNTRLALLVGELEGNFHVPIINGTGLTNRYDWTVTWINHQDNDTEAHNRELRKNLLDRMGLELVPTNMPIEMLVVERVKD